MIETGHGLPFASISPVTGEALGRWTPAGRAEVAEAAARVRVAAAAWREVSLAERCRLLQRARGRLLARADDLVAAITLEVGKPLIESYGAEVLPTLAALRDLPGRSRRLLRPRRGGGGRWEQRREPYGVIGLISTWNYPLFLTLPVLAAALVTGNGVLWKPSELAMTVSDAVLALLREAGMPRDLVRLLPGAGETGRLVAEAPCDKVLFIGGREAGRAVLTAAGARGRPAVAELSGNDPMIVCADAPLAAAIDGALWGRLSGAGQTCTAPRRIYVAAPLYTQFLDRLREGVARLRVGDPRDPGTEIGPLRTPEQVRRCRAAVTDALARGARLLYGGRPLPRVSPCAFEPALLADVNESMQAMREDLFGPVLCVAPVADEEEALRRANACPLALGASVWTRDRRRGRALADRLRGGLVCVNEVLLPAADPAVPFGGMGDSGYGRLRGDAGLLEFVQARARVEADPDRPRYHGYPYGAAKLALLQAFLGLSRGPAGARLRAAAALIGAARRVRQGE